MSSFCIGAIACDRFRFIMQPQKSQMTAKQVPSTDIEGGIPYLNMQNKHKIVEKVDIY
jgi:hypothetical protein